MSGDSKVSVEHVNGIGRYRVRWTVARFGESSSSKSVTFQLKTEHFDDAPQSLYTLSCLSRPNDSVHVSLQRKSVTCNDLPENGEKTDAMEIIRCHHQTVDVLVRIEGAQKVGYFELEEAARDVWGPKEFELARPKTDADTTFTVYVELTFGVTSRGMQSTLKQLGDLFTKQIHCDVHFRLKDEEAIGAHAAILRAGSPVFDAKFRQDDSRDICIEDVQPEIFTQLLYYLYTGSSLKVTGEIVRPLYLAADKYGVKELKEECLSFLLGWISVDSAIDVLAWSHLHSIAPLKEAVHVFIARHKQELRTYRTEWEKLVANHPELAESVHSYMTDAVTE